MQKREHSLSWRAWFSSQTSLGRIPSFSELDESSGPSPWFWHSGVSQICSSSEMLWFVKQVFPIKEWFAFTFAQCPPARIWTPGLLCHSGKITRSAKESAILQAIRRGGEKCTSYFKMSFFHCSQASLTKQVLGLPGNQAASHSYI